MILGKCNANGHCYSLCQQKDDTYVECKCNGIASQKCMICCRKTIGINNGTCKPIQDIFPSYEPKYLSDGRACYDGICMKRECKQKVKDFVGRLWKVIQIDSISGFVEVILMPFSN